MRLPSLLLPLLAATALSAGEAPPATAAAAIDPTAAIVAQGRFLYRQRDVDALVAIARRHAGKAWSGTDEGAAGAAIAGALRAREDFLAAIAALPPALRGRARDALILDLLAYEADPAPTVAGTGPTPAAVVPAVSGPVLVRLPQPTVRRVLGGRPRTLAVGVALAFASESAAKALEAQAPVLQDALLAAVHALPDAQFTQPDHTAVKTAIDQALRLKVPALPAGSVLLAALEAREE